MSAAAESLSRAEQAEFRYWRRCRRARGDLATFIELCATDEDGRPIELAPIHLSWIWHVDYCWARGKHAGILAPFGSGKCQPAGSPVQMADGSVVPIENLDGIVASVLAYDREACRYEPAWARAFRNGPRRVLRLNLNSGRSIDVTEEHPLLAVPGWRAARDVAPGSFVAVANNLPGMGHQRLRHGEAALLGFLVGDGSLTGGNATVTNGDEGVLTAVERAAALLGFSSLRKVSGRGVPAVAMAGGVRPWARAHGIGGHGSWTKQTPPAIFTAPPEQVAEYLGAYLACDGHVGARGSVELYSVNRALLLDAQALFARLGVVTRLRLKRGRYKGAEHLSWRLRASLKSIDALKKFPVPGAKGAAIAALRRNPSRPGNGDVVPLEYRALLGHARHWYKKNAGVSLDQAAAKGYRQRGTEREIVRRAAEAEGNAALLRATDPTLVWDEVTSVEDLGVMETWGLSVDRHQTYVASGLVVHNTSAFAIPLVAYLIGQNAQERLKYVCNGDDFAKLRLASVKRIVESAVYRDVFPEVRPWSPWGEKAITVRRQGFAADPTVQARGVETMGVGLRADHIVFDDICDQANTEEEGRRQRVKSLARGTWMSRLDSKGAERPGLAAMIATAWHPDDATHDFMNDPNWCFLVQRVSGDLLEYEQEVFGAGEDYLEGAPSVLGSRG